jgi:hypothetical protein
VPDGLLNASQIHTITPASRLSRHPLAWRAGVAGLHCIRVVARGTLQWRYGEFALKGIGLGLQFRNEGEQALSLLWFG